MPAIKPYDWLFLISATLFNLLIAAIFIAQKQAAEAWVARFGRIWLLTAIPFVLVLLNYLSIQKPRWVIAGLAVVLVYMLVEFLLDYIFHFDFRAQWSTHAPYIVLEYAALFSLIAIAISIDQKLGWLVGGSFWIIMGSLIYLYAG